MLRLSVNILTNVLSMLHDKARYNDMTLHEDVRFYSRYSVSMDAIQEMAITCNWIICDQGKVSLTSRGNQIVTSGQSCYYITREQLRMMLFDYIVYIRPIWANRIPYGRYEAAIFMTKDEKACFVEAELLINSENDVVKWWDTVSEKIRQETNTDRLLIGRIGEQLSMQYEEFRTGVLPTWISIDSNLAGYDILSIMDASDKSSRLIEVKTSCDKIEFASFFVTSNEWNVACSSRNYLFYLWHILPGMTPMLATISPEELRPHIPINQCGGIWQSAKINFQLFKNKFFEVTVLKEFNDGKLR